MGAPHRGETPPLYAQRGRLTFRSLAPPRRCYWRAARRDRAASLSLSAATRRSASSLSLRTAKISAPAWLPTGDASWNFLMPALVRETRVLRRSLGSPCRASQPATSILSTRPVLV